jgi:hypothetical protein
MAINVDKLIADAKARQDDARKTAETARKTAERSKADAKVIAESKNKMAYADTLKPRLKDYEERLKFFANKIARGDKLDVLEQKEFDKLVKDYKSLNATVDNAIKESYDIVDRYERKRAEEATGGKPAITTTVTQGPTGSIATKPVTSGTKTTKPVISTPAKGTTQDKTDSGTGVSAQGTVNTTTLEGIAAASGVTPEGPTGTPTVTATGNRTLEQILGDVQNYFDLPDYIFKLDKDLGNLLVRAVNEKWTAERWDKEIENTNWWRKNSSEVRKRLTQFGNYKDLQSQGQDVSKSDFGLWLKKKKGQLKADARTIAGYALTDAEAEDIAQKIYLGFLDDDENAIRAFLVPYIGKTTSIVNGMKMTGYSGQALKDYQTLQAIAKSNGLSLKDILPGISATTTGGDLEEAVLEKLALGELDIGRISQDARSLAAIGQPEMVRGLLNQGYDLDQVYSPYKNIMSNVLELNPEQISLNDPTLRSAISDKGETNLYDFQRMLRKDSRWQYTQNARQEIGDITLNVLRDFGFQG